MEFLDLNKISSIIETIWFQFSSQGGPFDTFVFIFKNGGWLPVLFALFWGLKETWLYWRQGIYAAAQQYVLLALDVPRENEQGPKAVENVFSHVYGAYKKPNLIEKYWDGFLCPKFSFELISLGGYLQFLIHTPVKFRDLVEAAIYAQYPDAEISEVEDYAASAPSRFRGTAEDMWGCEFVLYNNNWYPIRTYPSFEYGLTQEFKDPMAATLELMGKINPEENIWLQLVITPIPTSWTEGGQKLIKKLIGAKVPSPKPGLLYSATTGVTKGIWETATYTLIPPQASQEKKQESQRSEMLYLSPGERASVEAIESKISKNAFDVRFRFIYWGKKPVFSKQRGVSGMLGAIAQVNSLDLNGFKSHPKTKVTVDYFFVKTRQEWRRQRLMRAYKSRTNWAGWGRSILNIEELATLWHFPMLDIRTPMLKKTQAKRVESPFALPVETLPLEYQAAQDSGLAPAAGGEGGEALTSEPEILPTPSDLPPAGSLESPEQTSNQKARSLSQLRSPAKKSGPPSNLPTG